MMNEQYRPRQIVGLSEGTTITIPVTVVTPEITITTPQVTCACCGAVPPCIHIPNIGSVGMSEFIPSFVLTPADPGPFDEDDDE